MVQNNERICFVISPIGEEGSDTRRRSDQVLTHIITPAANECGYHQVVRADRISEPGMITSQVIQHLLDDSLVVADLTGRNPNVFYELAVRHAVRKAVVQVIEVGESIPFDVAQSCTIQFDLHDLDSAVHCKVELVNQIKSVESDPGAVDTPISVAIDLQELRSSGNPLEKSSAEMISMLQDIRVRIEGLDYASRNREPDPRIAFQLEELLDRVHGSLILQENEEPTREQIEQATSQLFTLRRLMYESLAISPRSIYERRRRMRTIAPIEMDGSSS